MVMCCAARAETTSTKQMPDLDTARLWRTQESGDLNPPRHGCLISGGGYKSRASWLVSAGPTAAVSPAALRHIPGSSALSGRVLLLPEQPSRPSAAQYNLVAPATAPRTDIAP